MFYLEYNHKLICSPKIVADRNLQEWLERLRRVPPMKCQGSLAASYKQQIERKTAHTIINNVCTFRLIPIIFLFCCKNSTVVLFEITWELWKPIMIRLKGVLHWHLKICELRSLLDTMPCANKANDWLHPLLVYSIHYPYHTTLESIWCKMYPYRLRRWFP